MGTIRLQIAPEIEFKMEMEVAGVDTSSRDYDVQQHKVEIYKEFERRLREAFPEGLVIHTLEFGLDTGWHDELKEK